MPRSSRGTAFSPFLSLGFFASLILSCSLACDPPPPKSILIMSYNTENLFDAKDDGGEYPEFSVAKGGWDSAAYKERLANLARVALAAAPKAGGPDILCLIEVENLGVLEELRLGALKDRGYLSSTLVAAHGQAANCGILSKLPIESARALGLDLGGRRGRYMLELHFDLGGSRLALFVCHWKSKIEGAEATEAERREAAGLLSNRIAEILALDPAADLVVCGDFNENPDEYERVGRRYPTAFMPLSSLIGWGSGGASEGPALFLAPSPEGCGLAAAEGGEARVCLYSPWPSSEGYSYMHKGETERIDGFLLAPGLFDGAGFSLLGFSPFSPDFLVDAEGLPVSYNVVTRKGFSDHLPILLELSLAAGQGGQ